MPRREDHFRAHDGLQLYYQCWLPNPESTATVVVLHGFSEHSGRYAQLAEALNGHGYTVYALDLRGHGRSEGERVFVESFDQYVADLDVFLELVSRRERGKPLFLFGHSMGGTIIARFAATRQPDVRQPDVRGLVLSAPGVRIGKHIFPILRSLASIAGRIFPRLRVVSVGARWVSRDPQVVTQFQNDPLVFHGRFPVRIGAEILRAAAELQQDAGRIRLPLLILQGTGDRVVAPEGSRELHARAASSDKTLQLYDGLYHDLLHEPEKAQVTADLLAWLDARQ